MDFVEISTPEDVGLRQEIAGPMSRLGAYSIDRLMLLLLQVLFVLMLLIFGLSMPWAAEELSGTAIAILVVFLGFSEFLYFGLMEWRRNGSTFGKKRTGLVVVMEGGHRLSPQAALLRNLFRPVDLLPIAWVVPFFDREHRRLGDLVAGTRVVRVDQSADKALVTPLAEMRHADLMERYLDISASDHGKLGSQEYLTLEEFLMRGDSFDEIKRAELAEVVLAPLLRRLGRERPPATIVAEALLEEIYLALRDNPRLLGS